MINLDNINNKISEILNQFNDYPIKRFVINNIENLSYAPGTKLYDFVNELKQPLFTLKLNVSFTVVHDSGEERSIENVDFIWFTDTIEDQILYMFSLKENMSNEVWPLTAPQLEIGETKWSNKEHFKLTDMYIENYFTHQRVITNPYAVEKTVYYFFNRFYFTFFDSDGYCNTNCQGGILYEDWKPINKLIWH